VTDAGVEGTCSYGYRRRARSPRSCPYRRPRRSGRESPRPFHPSRPGGSPRLWPGVQAHPAPPTQRTWTADSSRRRPGRRRRHPGTPPPHRVSRRDQALPAHGHRLSRPSAAADGMCWPPSGLTTIHNPRPKRSPRTGPRLDKPARAAEATPLQVRPHPEAPRPAFAAQRSRSHRTKLKPGSLPNRARSVNTQSRTLASLARPCAWSHADHPVRRSTDGQDCRPGCHP
jgi:hypothetical protein